MNRIEAQNWLIGEKKVRGVNFKLGLYIYRDDDGVICDQDGKAASNMTNPFSLDCFNAPFEIYEEKQADGFVDKEVLATQGDRFFGANYLGNWFPLSVLASAENFIGFVYMVNGKEHVHNSCIVYTTIGVNLYSFQVTGSNPIRPIAVRFRKDKDE